MDVTSQPSLGFKDERMGGIGRRVERLTQLTSRVSFARSAHRPSDLINENSTSGINGEDDFEDPFGIENNPLRNSSGCHAAAASLIERKSGCGGQYKSSAFHPPSSIPGSSNLIREFLECFGFRRYGSTIGFYDLGRIRRNLATGVFSVCSFPSRLTEEQLLAIEADKVKV